MSPHPYYADDAMLDAMADCETVCPQLHLPAQSGSDRLLKLMRRNYTAARFLERAKAARARIPGVVLSTDIIVGFPTETDEDFEKTLSLVEELKPVSAYCFKYSPREGTESAQSMPDDVPQEVKEDRLARLNAAVDRLTDEALKSQKGRVVEVLSEQKDFGRTADGFKVRWTKEIPVGTLAQVRVTGAAKRTLLGEIDEL
jgi:tRNA-2-methylthio-N6-dimethylallyladenosine synthase